MYALMKPLQGDLQSLLRDTLKQVPKFRELQFPNFQVPGTSSSEIKKLTKKCSTKHILNTAFCLSTHYSIAKLRA